MKKTNILFTHFGDDWIRGSERCLLDLLQYLNDDQYTSIVWCNSNVMEREVKKLGITVIKSEFTLLFGWENSKYNFVNYLTQNIH